jgi:hypothetical protein
MSYIGNEPIVSSSRTTYETIATAGQTSFSASYTVGFLDVYLNGVKLLAGDYVATSGSTVVLVSPAAANDEVVIVAYGTFSSANAVAKTGDTMTAPLKITGQPFFENGQEVTSDYSISANCNAMSAGAITINSGVTVTVPVGSNWVVV